MSKITQNTTITLSLAAAVFLCGGWATRIETKVFAQDEKIAEKYESYKEICGRLRGIESRLSGIEGQLSRLKK